MLFGSCSACCCPDLSFILQAESVEVELEYSFSDTNSLYGGYSSAFSGVYAIPRSGQQFPAVSINADGKDYSLQFALQSVDNQPTIRVIVSRLASFDSWRVLSGQNPPPFGSIGLWEAPCHVVDPETNVQNVPASTGIWSDTQFTVGNPGRPTGQFTFTFNRDNVTAFTGSVTDFPVIFRTANNQNLRNLANWCNGQTQRAFYKEEPTGSRFVSAYYFAEGGLLGDWEFSESLSILSLKAVFAEFSQNILFDVDEPVWSINGFRMETTGGGNSRFFDGPPYGLGYSTPCLTPFPNHDSGF